MDFFIRNYSSLIFPPPQTFPFCSRTFSRKVSDLQCAPRRHKFIGSSTVFDSESALNQYLSKKTSKMSETNEKKRKNVECPEEDDVGLFVSKRARMRVIVPHIIFHFTRPDVFDDVELEELDGADFDWGDLDIQLYDTPRHDENPVEDDEDLYEDDVELDEFEDDDDPSSGEFR